MQQSTFPKNRLLAQHRILTLALGLLLSSSLAATASAQDAMGQSIFKVVPTPNDNPNDILLAVSASSPSDIWAVGETAIHYDGTEWKAFRVSMIQGLNNGQLMGVADISPTDAWAAGFADTDEFGPPNQVIEHWDGTQWSLFPNPPFPPNAQPTPRAMTAIDGHDIWAVGNEPVSASFLFEHWDGTAWTVTEVPDTDGLLFGASADASNDVWAVGISGFAEESSTTLVFHFDGTAWQQAASANTGVADQLNAVVALAPNDVWAVGSTFKAEHTAALTLIEHYDGTAWSVVPSPNIGPHSSLQSNVLNGITALSPTDIYAFGSVVAADGSEEFSTLVLHWDGTAWTVIPSPDPPGKGGLLDVLYAGVSPAPGSLWIVGTEHLAPGDGSLAIHTTEAVPMKP